MHSHLEIIVLTASLLLGYLFVGLAGAVTGPILPSIADELGVSLSRATFASITIFQIGSVAGSFVPGALGLYDRLLGTVRSVAVALALLLGGCACFTYLTSFAAGNASFAYLAGCALFHGFCNGSARTGSNFLLLRVHSAAASKPLIGALHFGSGVGRLLAGLLGSSALKRGAPLAAFGWTAAAMALPMAALVLSAALWREPNDASSGETFASKAADAAALVAPTPRRKAAASGAASSFVRRVAIFVCVAMGVQTSLSMLLPAYAFAASPPLDFSDKAEAALVATAFGSTFAIGRLLAVPLSARIHPTALLKGSLVGSVLSLIAATIFSRSSLALWVAATALGLFLAPVFPTTINLLKAQLGDEMTGSQLSTVMLAGNGGAVLCPQAIGFLLDGGSAGASSMMQILALATLVDVALLWVVLDSAPTRRKLKL